MPRREVDYRPLTVWNVPQDRFFFSAAGSGIYSYIFVEDVGNYIMPYGVGRSSGKKTFQVNISNPSLEMEAKALFHISYGRDPFIEPLSEVIFEFIREIARALLVSGGKAYFEIVEGVLRDNQESRPVHVLQLIHGKVIRFGKTYYQLIPRGLPDIKEKYIRVPQSKIWRVEVSRDFGGSKDIRALSNNLENLGEASLLGSEIIANQKDYFGFEFSSFHSIIDSAILRATRDWGWDMRMAISNQYALEYYLFYRMLRFGYSLAILRSDLLSKMNRLLGRLGYDAAMSFSGIPNPEDYLGAIKKMEQRQLSFKEASDLIYFAL